MLPNVARDNVVVGIERRPGVEDAIKRLSPSTEGQNQRNIQTDRTDAGDNSGSSMEFLL